MPTLVIDGITVQAREGTFLLDAIRQAGVKVPTLCEHPAVEPYGGCRLCVVDVTRKSWDGWQKLVVSCLFPVEDGLIVSTATPRIVETRRVLMDLLLARCPNTPLVQEMARDLGLEKSSYPPNTEKTDCVLCGLCTRICDVIGPSAIAAVDRGIGREIAPAFGTAPAACVGCLACAEICPTDHIKYETSDRKRTIWNKEFEMLRCAKCGRAHITKLQAAHFEQKSGVPRSYFETCDACKRAALAATTTALRA
jgi:NADH dehydrogenase/NADH:ubiquinone oxidoreductase subunit G